MLQLSYLLIQNKDSILRNKCLFEILIEFQDFEFDDGAKGQKFS